MATPTDNLGKYAKKGAIPWNKGLLGYNAKKNTGLMVKKDLKF